MKLTGRQHKIELLSGIIVRKDLHFFYIDILLIIFFFRLAKMQILRYLLYSTVLIFFLYTYVLQGFLSFIFLSSQIFLELSSEIKRCAIFFLIQ